MSGNFVQRGEPAVFDKWVRAEMALAAGADLVVEIPTWFVLRSAEGFARAGIALLAACGMTDLSFGSEAGDLSALTSLAGWLKQADTQERIRTTLQTGISYAAAVQHSAQESGPAIADMAHVLRGANNVLAVEYLRFLSAYAPQTHVHTVKRMGAAHGGRQTEHYAGAMAIRNLLKAGRTAEVRPFLPECTAYIFEKAMTEGPAFSQDYVQALFYALLAMDEGNIRSLPACSEGLENRVLRALRTTEGYSELLSAIKTKRYPQTRIQRLLMQALLQFHQVEYRGVWAPYIRVLACSAKGKNLLPWLTRLAKAPLIFSARDVNKLAPAARRLLALDIWAADIYCLSRPGKITNDLSRRPVVR